MYEPRIPQRFRQEAISRARGFCEYCLSQVNFSSNPFSIDHIRPQRDGGTHDAMNLAFACPGCNGHKQRATNAIDPVSGKRVPLFNPRKHVRSEHFVWSDDSLTLLGRTATGRATVVRLQLNRAGVVNVRRLLRDIGLHPPTI